MSKIPVNWGIKNLDTGEVFQPQFPIDNSTGVTWSLGSTYAEQQRFGFQDPLISWTGGQTETFTFEMRLFAHHENIDIESILREFIALGRKDGALGRPPICVFTFGSLINETVVLAPMTPVIKDTLTNGKPRDVSIPVTLKKYTPFSQSAVDPSKRAKESFYLVASSNEASYEAIARRFYGDPMMGDRLRKRHPAMASSPFIGEQVKVPARSVILAEVVQPEGHMFDIQDANASDAFEQVASARNARRLTVIL